MTEDYDDSFDQKWNEEQDFREMEEFNQKVLRYQARKNAEATQELQNQMFKKALDKHGLTPEEFQQLAQMDPNFYNQAYADGLENLVRTVKERPRDPVSGRFISKAEAREHPQYKEQPQGQGVDQARIDALRAKGKKEGLSTDDDIAELLDSEIGRLF